MMNSNSNSQSANDEIDLGQLFATLMDGKWQIVSITSLFMIFGVVFALLSTPVYRADALLQIEEKSGGVSALTGELGDFFASEGAAVTEIEILKSRMVIGRTVDELSLTNIAEPNYLPLVGKGLNRLFGEPRSIELTTLGVGSALLGETLTLELLDGDQYRVFGPDDEVLLEGRIGELESQNGLVIQVASIEGEAGDTYSVTKEHRLKVITDLQKALSVSERGKQSGILSLAMEGPEGDKIERILDNTLRNYEAQNVAREAAQAERSLGFLQEQLPEIRERLETSENALNDYRQSAQTVDLTREAEALLDTLVELESQLNDLSFREAEIAQRYTANHPSYRTLLENRATLEAQQEELSARIRQLPETQREVLRMSRDFEVNQEVYTLLLNRTQELNVIKAGTVGFVRILDHAATALKPVKPKKPLIVVLATMLGGMIGVAVVLVKAFMNPGMTSTEGVEELGLPVYGNIPFSEEEKSYSERIAARLKNRGRKLRSTNNQGPLAERNPADLAIEAIRSLRTSLHFAQMDAENNVVMISGASPGIGKSFLSANLALTLASGGQRVLLIDADIRRGHMHDEFGIEKTPGLSNYLQGTNSVEDVVNPYKESGVAVVPVGDRAPNPAELLMHDRFKALLDWGEENFDLVIVDTPPILAVTDPAIVGRHAGVSLLVGRYGMSPLKEVDAAFDRFEQSGVQITAFILNAVERTRRASYGYGYQYDYQNADD